MKRPLELVVYEKEPGRYGGEALYNSPDGLWAYPASHADGYAQAKRLTDAELAAEYWRLRLKVCASGNRDMKAKGHVCIEWQTAHDELDAMQRFMDLPHYDEPTETGTQA